MYIQIARLNNDGWWQTTNITSLADNNIELLNEAMREVRAGMFSEHDIRTKIHIVDGDRTIDLPSSIF